MKQKNLCSKLIRCLLPCLIFFLCGASSCLLPGSIEGIVKDAVTDLPLANATVTLKNDDNTVETTTTDATGAYSFDTEMGDKYTVRVELSGYLAETYENILVVGNTATYLETILQIANEYTGSGTATGQITNAFTGEGVDSATISLRKGINATSGTVISTTTTLSDGSYSVTANSGNYTGEISKSGYTTAYFTITCIGGQTSANQNGAITPTIETGQTRIILTWGASPSDLDSHLTGPLNFDTRFHVYYEWSESDDGNADLDLDDTDSYGPETTTIYTQISGTYRFSVHDFSNACYGPSTELSNSGAKVRVYRGSTLVQTFNVPTGQTGDLWTVFQLNNNTITPVNTISEVCDEETITRSAKRTRTDAALMTNLPEK